MVLLLRVLELAGGLMEEFAIPSGPRKELINNHCSEFMQLIKDIQVTLREEIKSACKYRPFEKCDYIARISNEICCKKVKYVIEKLKAMKETIDAPPTYFIFQK
ncbi:putative mediator complex, subunit Med11 [Helianthus annuus]|nr:putative mediator complex, subunit Med11 [Helianthus annuus]